MNEDITWKQQLKQAGYPTTVLILDFETYWDKDYTLSKMSTIEYVCDPRFELTGLGTQRIDSGSDFCAPDEIHPFIKRLVAKFGANLESLTLVGQNLKFDCLILARHFGIFPRYTVDLIDLDRIWDARSQHNLAHMAKKWSAPKSKGDTNRFKSYHWADMSANMQEELAEYTKTDVEIEADLFQKLLPLVPNPEIELPLATQTLNMYLHPQIEIDAEVGTDLKARMQLEMLKPLETLREVGLDCSHEDISGNKKFVELLNQELPVNEQVPMKAGKNGMIPALAREDEGLYYLLHHKRKKIRLLAEARLAVKSWPLHIKRVDNLMNQATCSGGKIGAPLKYYGGHTGRWSGAEAVNLQNLGGRGRGKSTHPLISEIRHLLKAPDGFVFGVPDFSQIEARILAWLAGQQDLIQIFADGDSPYTDLATEVFQEPVRKPKDSDPEELRKDLAVKYGFGKDAILGCGYGMGADKFYARCRENENLRSLFDSGKYDWNFVDKLIKTYRQKYAKIPAFWRRVEKAWKFVTKYPKECCFVVYENRTHNKYNSGLSDKGGLHFCHDNGATFIYLPSGRFMRYPYASVNKRGDLLYRWGSLWGGSITENVVQAVARDVMGEALLRLEGAGYNLLFHSHDEIIALLHEQTAELWLQGMISVMSMQPSWAEGLPLAAEGKLVKRYEK